MVDGDGFLARFIDGPLASRAGIKNLAGNPGDFELKREVFPWPLPKRLGVLSHLASPNVAMWDADDPEASELPLEIVASPNMVVYVKVNESQLDHDVPHVMRGAEYKLEEI